MQRLCLLSGGKTVSAAGKILDAARHGSIRIGSLISITAAHRGLILAAGEIDLSAGDGSLIAVVGVVVYE